MATVHEELAGLSNQNPAGYIELACFGRLTLDKLQATIGLLKGKPIAAGSGALSAVMTDVIWTAPPQTRLVPPVNPTIPGRELDVAVTSDFVVHVAIFISGDPLKVISNLAIAISDARIHMRGESNMIVVEGSDFQFTRKITRTRDADELLKDAGIDPLEATRIEGHVGYGVVTQAVTTAIGRRSEIDLAVVFPAVNFGKSFQLSILQGGEALGIIPTETVTVNKSACCSCNEGPDLGVGSSTTTTIAPPNPQPGDEVAKVTIGGPIAEKKDPLKDFGPRPQSNKFGSAGLYIPAVFASALVVEVMPAIKITASDNGTIGFRAEASVGFKNFAVSFDVLGGGILLDIDLDISVNAYCDFELFKGFRIPIGWAIISPANGSKASLQLGFYPSVDNGGTVRLKSTLKRVDMGEYVAIVIGIGTALEIIGVTAWIGFLIDVVLSAILSRGLPIALRDELKKYLGGKEWKLINGVPVMNPLSASKYSAPWDAKPQSLLTSIAYRTD